MTLFREVFKARDRKTNRLVALKKVRMENEKEGVCWVIAWCLNLPPYCTWVLGSSLPPSSP